MKSTSENVPLINDYPGSSYNSLIKEVVTGDDETASKKDVVVQCTGGWGPWHRWICFAICLIKLPVAWHQLVHIFIAPPAFYRCVDNVTDGCSSNCTELVYDRSVFEETTITQWNLVCDRAWLADLAQFLVMVGILLGNILFGYLSDRFGRRIPLLLAVGLQVISGVAVALVPWYWLFMLLRFLTAFATGGTMISSFVMVMELVRPSYRTPVGLFYQMPFNIGHMILAGIAYLLRDWHHIQLAVSIPTGLLLAYYFILPESPRWLLAVGRAEESIQVMEKIARYNKLPTQDIAGNVRKSVEEMRRNARKQDAGNLLDLFRTRIMATRTLCLCFNWMTCGLCFFGVAQYMGQIPGNIFLNVSLSAVVGIPGIIVLLYALSKFGRRNTLIASNIIAGVSCVLLVAIPPGIAREWRWAYTVLGTMGMLGMSMSFPTVYIFAGELYPTRVRNLGVGLCSMMSRIGSMMAPFVTRLTVVQFYYPPLIFGLLPLLAACLCYFLPETQGCKLPDSIQEAENIGNNNNKLPDNKPQ